jgi:hypothetical protein
MTIAGAADRGMANCKALTAKLLSLQGDRDAVRFGEIRFSDGLYRRFHIDLLTGRFELFTTRRFNLVADLHPARAAAAAVLRAAVEAVRPTQGHL